jgi:hypothetical protein
LPARRRSSISCAATPPVSSSRPHCRPALTAGAHAAIRHLKASQAERDIHQKRAATLKRRLAEAGLPVMPSASHIVPVIVGDPALCKAACDELLPSPYLRAADQLPYRASRHRAPAPDPDAIAQR